MPQQNAHYRIGQLAQEFNISTRAIRIYEQKKLLQPGRDGLGRRFSERDRERLVLILRGKNLGFSLEEIRDFLVLCEAEPGAVAQTHYLLNSVEQHIDCLHRKRADIEQTLRQLEALRQRCLDNLRRQNCSSAPGDGGA